MAFDTAVFENPHTGQIKEAPIGFSWTMFFFGFFPPLLRGDWKWVAIILGLGIISFGVLGWIAIFVGCFIWNKSYMNTLIERGYRLKDTHRGNPDSVDVALGYRAKRLED